MREGSLDGGRHVPQHQLEAARLAGRQAEVLADPALDLVERGVDPGGVLGQGQADHAGVVGVAVAAGRKAPATSQADHPAGAGPVAPDLIGRDFPAATLSRK